MSIKPEIYVSYAWNARDEDGEDGREHIVDKFCEACEQRGYIVKRDKTAVGYRDSIESFMRQIGAGKYVLAVVSAKYLFSEACMFEAVQMLAHERFEERVFPVILPDSDIFKTDKALDYKIHWNDKAKAYSKKLDLAGRDSAATEWQIKERLYKDIHEHIGEFITRIVRLNVLSPSKHLEDNFSDLFAALETQIEKDRAVDKEKPSNQSTSLPEPVFPKLNVNEYTFEQALRPAQTKSLVAKLPAALNLVSGRGQGCFRMLEGFDGAGLHQVVYIIRIKLSAYLTSYSAFLGEIARQGKVNPGPDLVELLRTIAIHQQKPILFIVENLDDMYEGRPNMDPRFDIGFLQKLNALKNALFIAPMVCSHTPIRGLSFQGQSSPFAPETVSINPLSYEDLLREINRQLPDLSETLARFMAEQLEYEPNHTYDLLDGLIQALDGRSNPSRDFIGQELKTLRLKYGRS